MGLRTCLVWLNHVLANLSRLEFWKEVKGDESTPGLFHSAGGDPSERLLEQKKKFIFPLFILINIVPVLRSVKLHTGQAIQ